MGWLQRLFGQEKPAETASAPVAGGAATAEAVPIERMGLNGEYDQSGLAKRVALAFDNDPTVADIDTVWVAQTGTTIVLKGKVPTQATLSKLMSIAQAVSGTGSVEVDQVSVG